MWFEFEKHGFEYWWSYSVEDDFGDKEDDDVLMVGMGYRQWEWRNPMHEEVVVRTGGIR